MITEVCQYLRNWFTKEEFKHFGDFTISEGRLVAPVMLDGQYFRIVGSRMNDGVWQYPKSDLNDETFNGAVWEMSIPQAVLDIVAEIDAWQAKYAGIDSSVMSPYTSESFGGYSYSKATGADGSTSWKTVFAGRLAPWRKI